MRSGVARLLLVPIHELRALSRTRNAVPIDKFIASVKLHLRRMSAYDRRIARIAVDIATKLNVPGYSELSIAKQHDLQMVAVLHLRSQSPLNVLLNPKGFESTLTKSLQATVALKMIN